MAHKTLHDLSPCHFSDFISFPLPSSPTSVSPQSQEPLHCSSSKPQGLCTELFFLEPSFPHTWFACSLPSDLVLRSSLRALGNSSPNTRVCQSLSIPLLEVLVQCQRESRNHSAYLKQGNLMQEISSMSYGRGREARGDNEATQKLETERNFQSSSPQEGRRKAPISPGQRRNHSSCVEAGALKRQPPLQMPPWEEEGEMPRLLPSFCSQVSLCASGWMNSHRRGLTQGPCTACRGQHPPPLRSRGTNPEANRPGPGTTCSIFPQSIYHPCHIYNFLFVASLPWLEYRVHGVRALLFPVAPAPKRVPDS